MCDCHPMTPSERTEWNRVKQETRTRADWEDLHDTIEAFKRRLMARHRVDAAILAESQRVK